MSIDLALSGILDEIQTLVLDRHQKYGPLNISSAPGGPLNGLRVRLYDKLARINHALDSGGQVDFDDDSFRDAFIDTAGYALIGLLVLDGKWPGATPAEKPLADYVDDGQWLDKQIDALCEDAYYRNSSHLSGATHRYSALAKNHDDPPPATDAWRVGTTFQPDPPAQFLWTREPGGWRWSDRGESGNYLSPSLPEIVERQGYPDGTITEPTTSKEEAA